ncbi:folylpolyglutamate synthase/dihydrofolate synthase family protein [Novosphingobium sp. Gsoil 351]|uniref:bifunctional folylpolyglutamate synthase/dihydrofolate synthase n=1 Tax=Novosphingobium sp. Gsoil 351 TaxID=2675225 RepID=UPI0012B46C0E|nr:folylpolyglutamate synthase/dihydrofolate synthase family protein [Novosphingobium sp. Gsoil 351]QGN53613.1 bifunctional folylpolyglutamate synthase/dihydrofolate synthase [Novosphingobium sp. Gsoil 351]
MKDFATSSDPAVQHQLDRLAALSLPQGRFELETIRALCARLGNPERHLPPVFHVAGTNGKGSTCAYLRAILEAQGCTVHAATKPHLVRYNERIRIAGKLVSDAELAALLAEVLDAGEDLSPSFFEVTTAATFLAFARHPADACVIEVGLGGRFDATNILEGQAVCGIASLGIDHEAFLLAPEAAVPAEPLSRIGFEKAGIARAGVPLVTQTYPLQVTRTIIEHAMIVGARTAIRDLDWFAEIGERIAYRDAHGELVLPLPEMPGRHQADNAALAVAMLRHQESVTASPEAMAEGIRVARWPARLQLLGAGPLTALAPGRRVWLDGGHNRDAGEALARFFRPAGKVHLIIGMLASKAPAAIVGPLEASLASLTVVPIPRSETHPSAAFGPDASPAADVASALAALPGDGRDVLITGSLYLAGEVLRLNQEEPD